MRGRKIVVLSVALVLVFGLGSASLAADKIVLKLAHHYPPGHPHYLGVELFKKLVEERSRGEIEVQIFPNNQLGDARQVFENLILGTVDIALTDQGQPGIVGQPLWDILQSPYMYRDYNHANKVFHSDLLQKMYDKAEKEIGVTTLDPMWYYGVRHLTMAKKAVKEPGDLKGMKVRAPTIQVFMKAVEFMGASPVPIAFPDLYLALKQSVVDGQENPVATIYANKYYEAQKYLILTGHILSKNAVFMNTAKWKSLSLKNQKIVKDAILEAGRYNDKLMLDQEDDYLKKLQDLGMVIVKPDRAAFEEAAEKGLRSWFNKEQYELYKEIQKVK